MDGYTLGLMQLEFGNIEFYALFLDRILYNSRVEKVQQGYKDNTKNRRHFWKNNFRQTFEECNSQKKHRQAIRV